MRHSLLGSSAILVSSQQCCRHPHAVGSDSRVDSLCLTLSLWRLFQCFDADCACSPETPLLPSHDIRYSRHQGHPQANPTRILGLPYWLNKALWSAHHSKRDPQLDSEFEVCHLPTFPVSARTQAGNCSRRKDLLCYVIRRSGFW